MDDLDSFLAAVAAEPIPNPLDAFLTTSSKPVQRKQVVSTEKPFIFKYGPDGCILPSPAAIAEMKYRASLSEDTCCSFEEWKQVGYWVKKGAKSMFKDALGIPQFTIEQVTPPRYR